MNAAIAGVVLAAGSSSRLGSAKQLLTDANDQTLVARAAQLLLDSGCDPVVVITGAARADVLHALSAMPIVECFNPEWERGMGESIARGVRWLLESADADVSACLILACDMPSVTREHVAQLIATSDVGLSRVASQYNADDGREIQGVPAVLPRADWPLLSALTGDRGARDLLRDPHTLSVPLRLGNLDLDTPADVARWRGQL